jgi:hypothetical protein
VRLTKCIENQFAETENRFIKFYGKWDVFIGHIDVLFCQVVIYRKKKKKKQANKTKTKTTIVNN